MGAKFRLKNQFRWSMDYLALRHDNAADFYLSCWQRNKSPVPLLSVRIVLFIGALATIVASLILTGQRGRLAFWATYQTQWGLILNVFATGLATAVSFVACFKKRIDAPFGIPWYVRLCWMVNIIAYPVALFVTIFYYSLLTDAYPEGEEPDPVLDVFVHGINSVLMFCLIMTSQLPIYFFQMVYPIVYLLVYVIFSVIYYFAGGTSPFGDPVIYPMLDWTNPGPTIGLVFACTAVMIIIFIVVSFINLLRDYLSRKWNTDNTYVL